MLARVDLNLPDNNDKGESFGRFGKPICNIGRSDGREGPIVEQSRWIRPTEIVKMVRFKRPEVQIERRNMFQKMSDEDQKACCTLGRSEELLLKEDDERPTASIEKWNKKYNRQGEPTTGASTSVGIMECEECTFGTPGEEISGCRIKRYGCDKMVTTLSQVDGSAKPTAKLDDNNRKTQLNCVTKVGINIVQEESSNKNDDIEVKVENLKFIGDQIRDSLDKV